jgi:acyl-CoA synthetase (AMP-forming)/AMP-acid ligase II
MALYLLEDCKLKRGERALLVFFPGLQFMVSLIACFKAGIIAVPVFPPDPRKQKKDLHHFISIQSSSGAEVVLSHSLYNVAKKMSAIKNIFSGSSWPDLRWISVDGVISKAKTAKKTPTLDELPALSDTDIAFLQYTSGSTSEPKGVMISHGNLAHNEMLIATELKTSTDTVCVSWLPQYHDMGLIGSYLGLLTCGGAGYYLSPISFLKNPVQWLKSMSEFRATHTQAPNFAYALVTRKYLEMSVEARKSLQLDLSSLQHMINAAEPVDDDALTMFYDTFSPFGLPPDVIFPTYGLAESTVFVCSGGSQRLEVVRESLEGRRVEVVGGEQQQQEEQEEEEEEGKEKEEGGGEGGEDEESLLTGEENTKKESSSSRESSQTVVVVGCGYPSRGEGVTVIIVDPDTGDMLQEDDIGEIWVDSPSKALGYWEKPDVTATEFFAKPTNYPTSDTFLRTGDLGFMHNSELFICGRLKDLIIVRGSNHYPQDIERTVEAACPQLRAGCSAAFSMKSSGGVKQEEQSNSHTEGVMYVAEVKADVSPSEYSSIIDTARAAVTSDHGVSLLLVALLKVSRVFLYLLYFYTQSFFAKLISFLLSSPITKITITHNCIVFIFSMRCAVLQTRTVPKTTSGKIARSWCRRAWVDGTLQIVQKWEGAMNEADVALEEEEDAEGGGRGGGGGGGGVGGGDMTALETDTEGSTPIPSSSSSSHTAEELRALSLSAIEQLLETKLAQVSAQGPAPLTLPIDRHTSFVAFGLDSMTVVQFKGVIENRCCAVLCCDVLYCCAVLVMMYCIML